MGTLRTSEYRLLACDLDGTLMGDDTIIPARVRQALAKAQARGIYVTLATGRGYQATLPFARSLNIGVPLICYQGGLIIHPVTAKVLYRATMEHQLVLEAIKLGRIRDWHLVVYIDDATYVEKLHYPQAFYDSLLGANTQCVSDLARVVHESGSQPAKFLFVADEAKCDRIQTELSAHFGKQINVVRSHLLFVEGNPLGANKGDALHRLADHLDVPQAQVMAIGDQSNDVPMLAWAGLGIAMESGSTSARAASDWIAPPLSGHGAAVAIERFLTG